MLINLLSNKLLLTWVVIFCVPVSVYHYVHRTISPTINPHPRYYMTVKGHVDKKLRDNLKITWFSEYYTTNPQCNRTVNWSEGIDAPQMVTEKYPIKIQPNGDYQLKIPMDQYSVGECGWEISGVYYHYSYGNFSHTIGGIIGVPLAKSGIKKDIALHQNIICHDKDQCHLTPGGNRDFDHNISSYQNTTTIINFHISKDKTS